MNIKAKKKDFIEVLQLRNNTMRSCTLYYELIQSFFNIDFVSSSKESERAIDSVPYWENTLVMIFIFVR